MRRAFEKAKEVVRSYRTTEPAVIADELGICVLEEELTGRLREIYFGDSIVIRIDLSPEEKREVLAHALGHHLMHLGNPLAMQKRVYSFGNHHEHQADAFAACLLVPEGKLEDQIRAGEGFWEIAQNFRVTEQLLTLRLKIRAAMTPAWEGSHELCRLP